MCATPAPPDATITKHLFREEELALMRNCLTAMTRGDLVALDDLEDRHFHRSDDYADFLKKFDGLHDLSRDDLRVIEGAVWFIANNPAHVEDFVWETGKLEAFLGVGLLHVGWFVDRLHRVLEEWDWSVEYSDRLKEEMW